MLLSELLNRKVTEQISEKAMSMAKTTPKLGVDTSLLQSMEPILLEEMLMMYLQST